MEKITQKAFRMPHPVKLSGRTSTITNSFVNGIIPVRMPTEEQIHRALEVLGMSSEDVRCAYCGDPSTEWDHLKPIVSNKRPTGYISEISNLVPACGKCNQSKNGRHWKDWMLGPAAQSPRTRRLLDLEERISRLERYETTFRRVRIDFESVIPPELWRSHWDNHDRLHRLMHEFQKVADQVKEAAERAAKA